MSEWSFAVIQNDMIVAEGSASVRDDAVREAMHYVAMYGQDGPVEAHVWEGDLRPKGAPFYPPAS